MIPHSQTDVRGPRLNPFAFPSDTTFRFVLLIVFALTTSLSVYPGWLVPFFPALRQIETASMQCVLMAIEHTKEQLIRSSDLNDLVGLGQCVGPGSPGGKLLDFMRVAKISGIALLLAVAAAIYWLWPTWKIKRDRLEPLSINDAPEVVAYLADLCREAGLVRQPFFVWKPLHRGTDALAFGRFRHYYIALRGGLVTMFHTDRPAFRAIVLHELAHLRNADVNKTYFAVAIWWACVITALIPYGTSLVWRTLLDLAELRNMLSDSWRILTLIAVVYLTRNGLLRVRELYADVRASVWDGPSGELGRVLELHPRSAGGRWRAMVRVLQVHPDPSERLRVLNETHRLFHLGFWDAIGAGIAIATGLPAIISLLGLLILPLQDFGLGTEEQAFRFWTRAVVMFLGPALLLTPLTVGAVGLGVWRATFAALMRGEIANDASRLGLALALGVLLGDALTFTPGLGFSSLDIAYPEGPPLVSQVLLLGFNVLWGVLLVASLFLFFKWVGAAAGAWLEAVLRSRSPRLVYLVGLTLASGSLILWFEMLAVVPLFIRVLSPLLSNYEAALALALFSIGAFVGVAITPLNLPALISLWAFPLAAWFWCRRAASAAESNWAFLDLPAQSFALPHQAPLRPGLALIIGLAGGLIFCGLQLIVSPWFGRIAAIVQTALGSTAFFLILIALAALTQACIAMIVAGSVKRLGALHGLFSAFIAGSVIAAGMLGELTWLGATIDLSFATFISSAVIYGGALMALPAALGAAVIAGWMRDHGSVRG